MCEVWGCPRRVVSYKEKKVGDASMVRSVNIPPKKVLNVYTRINFGPTHSEEPKDSRKIHASNRNHVATAKVEVVVFKSLDVIETTAHLSKYEERYRSN